MDEYGVPEGQETIKLDGSLGLGARAHLTITTKDEALGEKNETFEVPYLAINFDQLKKALDFNFIRGFALMKVFEEPQQ